MHTLDVPDGSVSADCKQHAALQPCDSRTELHVRELPSGSLLHRLTLPAGLSYVDAQAYIVWSPDSTTIALAHGALASSCVCVCVCVCVWTVAVSCIELSPAWPHDSPCLAGGAWRGASSSNYQAGLVFLALQHGSCRAVELPCPNDCAPFWLGAYMHGWTSSGLLLVELYNEDKYTSVASIYSVTGDLVRSRVLPAAAYAPFVDSPAVAQWAGELVFMHTRDGFLLYDVRGDCFQRVVTEAFFPRACSPSGAHLAGYHESEADEEGRTHLALAAFSISQSNFSQPQQPKFSRIPGWSHHGLVALHSERASDAEHRVWLTYLYVYRLQDNELVLSHDSLLSQLTQHSSMCIASLSADGRHCLLLSIPGSGSVHGTCQDLFVQDVMTGDQSLVWSGARLPIAKAIFSSDGGCVLVDHGHDLALLQFDI